MSVAGHVFTKMFMHMETHVSGPAKQNSHHCLYGLNRPQIHMLKPYIPGPMNVTELEIGPLKEKIRYDKRN